MPLVLRSSTDSAAAAPEDLESVFFDLELEMEKSYCRDLVSTSPKYENGWLLQPSKCVHSVSNSNWAMISYPPLYPLPSLMSCIYASVMSFRP